MPPSSAAKMAAMQKRGKGCDGQAVRKKEIVGKAGLGRYKINVKIGSSQGNLPEE